MAILLRTDKGSKLSYIEADENFSSLFYSASIDGNILSLFYTGSQFAPSINPVTIDIPQGSSNWTVELDGSISRNSAVKVLGNVRIIGAVTGSTLRLSSLPVGTNETRILVADSSGNVRYRTDLQLQGTQGIQGITGTGAQGATGLQGTAGLTGLQGIQGYTGDQGLDGIQGFTGLQGALGMQGIQGIQGNQGTQGIQGNTGIQGNQGTQGIQGNTGTQGTQGIQGIQGIQGNQGTQGIQGNQGTQGVQGVQGTTGATGLGFAVAKTYISVAALQADTSPSGIVAGQFALIDTGDVEDADNSKLYIWDGNAYVFVNDLSGTAGIQGIQGTQGVQGTQGIQGTEGLQGTQGTQGIQGVQGTQGVQGDLGIQGTQGTQGTQGIQGIQGTQGIQGIEGLQGIQGIQGTEGIQGTDGIQGSQGTQGVQGTQGIQGETGIQGSQGTQGLQGIQGTQGAQGTQGIQGTQGTQGVTGVRGSGIVFKNGLLTMDGGEAANYGKWIGYYTQGLTTLTGIYLSTRDVNNTLVDSWVTQIQAGFSLTITIESDPSKYGIYTVQSISNFGGGLYDIDLALVSGTAYTATENERAVIAWQPKGIQGTQGTQGTQGIQGTQGTQGTQGVQGIQGISVQGTQGTQGVQGTRGIQGEVGTQGIQGISVQGLQGIQGVQGTAGTQGLVGTTGLGFTIAKTYVSVAALLADTSPSGIVAGQFALIDTTDVQNADNSKLYLWNGSSYIFTNDLSGAAGIQGIQGTQGISVQGVQGRQGTTGSQGTIGTTIQGTQGIQGTIGTTIQGTQGVQGISIQGTTGTTIQGTTGSQGTAGTNGSPGTQGTAGTNGSPGTQGTTGASIQGTAGTNGSPGIQGTAGTNGSPGIQGSTGSTSYDAGTLSGLSIHTARNNEANKIVRTDANGYIQAGWINTTSGDNGTTAIDRVYASDDGYIRYYTPANFRQVLDVPTRTGGSASGTWGISITGRAFPKRVNGTNINFNIENGIVNSGTPTAILGTTNNIDIEAYSTSGLSVNYAASAGSATDSTKLPLAGGTLTGGLQGTTATLNSITLNQNPVGDTYGSGQGGPPNSFYQPAGNDDGFRIYAESPGTNRVRAVFQIEDDIETESEQWVFRNKMTYSGLSATTSVSISGAGTLTAAQDIVAYSDRRVKENINTIDNALEKVKALRGVTYNRIDKSDKSEKIGVIAQEIQEVLPQVVHEQEDGMLGVSYGNIVAVLIEAIKEQQKQIDELMRR